MVQKIASRIKFWKEEIYNSYLTIKVNQLREQQKKNEIRESFKNLKSKKTNGGY